MLALFSKNIKIQKKKKKQKKTKNQNVKKNECHNPILKFFYVNLFSLKKLKNQKIYCKVTNGQAI